MIINVRNLILGLALVMLPVITFASTAYKGTETVNINKANAATMAAYLKGIGASKAEAIVAYRKSNGNFKALADLKEVPGIGEETFKNVKSKISTSKGKTTAPEGYKLSETKKKSTSTKATSKKTADSSKAKSSSTKSSTSKAKSTVKSSTSKAKSTAKKTTAKSKKLLEEEKKK